MKYKGIIFDAIIATPGCGKSYLCDRDSKYIDVDEVRLRCKYIVPDNITRHELELTKGDRQFEKQGSEYLPKLFNFLDKYVSEGKILIAAPHPESYGYFALRNIKFCFIHPSMNARQEIKRRMIFRGNSEKIIKENDDKFNEFYESNCRENRSAINYEFEDNEYLSDIIKKFNV